MQEYIRAKGGCFSAAFSIRCNYKWPRAEGKGEPIRSLLACQPKTNCLLALTAGFYLHNSNPRAKAICTLPTLKAPCLQGGTWSTEAGGRRRKPSHKWMKTPPCLSGWINRGHNHTLMQVNTPQHAFFAMHKTETQTPPCLFKPDSVIFPP